MAVSELSVVLEESVRSSDEVDRIRGYKTRSGLVSKGHPDYSIRLPWSFASFRYGFVFDFFFAIFWGGKERESYGEEQVRWGGFTRKF
jgi:hypothetical protein